MKRTRVQVQCQRFRIWVIVDNRDGFPAGKSTPMTEECVAIERDIVAGCPSTFAVLVRAMGNEPVVIALESKNRSGPQNGKRRLFLGVISNRACVSSNLVKGNSGGILRCAGCRREPRHRGERRKG